MFTIDEEVPLLRIKGRHLTLDQMVQIAIGAKMIYTGYGDELEAARRVDYLCMVGTRAIQRSMRSGRGH